MRSHSPANYYRIRDRIAFLKALAHKNAPISNFEHALDSILRAKALPCTSLQNPEFFRARWNQLGRLFEHESELIYPDPGKVSIRKGRLNDENESIFYGAISVLGTLIELRPELNRFFTISTIKKKTGPDPFFYVVGDVKAFSGLPTPNSSERLVRAYLDSELIKVVAAPDEYNPTVAIAKMLLHKGVKSQEMVAASNLGLAYPSVESRKIASDTTYNVAFLPKIYDAHYLISETVVYVLISKPDCYVLHDVNKGHVTAGGSIGWLFDFAEMKDRISKGITSTGVHAPEIAGLEAML